MRCKQTIIGGIAFVFLVSVPLTASFAMQDMGHSSAPHAMDGMEMATKSTGASIMLNSDVQEGVKALAHLQDIKEAMAQYGGKETHHFMVQFSSDGAGERVDAGLAAVKIIDPEGKKLNPLEMMAMDGSFGVDVALTKNGTYLFEVGTKLSDGKKRLFRFQYKNV